MVVLISGATSGIGKTIAEQLHQEGYRVFGAGRRAEDFISNNGISMLKMDVTNDVSVQQAVQRIIQEVGRIDVLIQCAGQGAIGPIEEFTPEEIANVFNLNLLGILRVNKAVIPHMRNQNSGRIIHISSLAAEAGLPYQGVYCASKAALDVMTESLRMELKKFQIDICCIQPGDFKTEVVLHRKMPKLDSNSPYKEAFNRINSSATNKVESAPDPKIVAQKVIKILKRKKFKSKYRVGSGIERMMPKIKSIIPSGWFEKLLMKYYKL